MKIPEENQSDQKLTTLSNTNNPYLRNTRSNLAPKIAFSQHGHER